VRGSGRTIMAAIATTALGLLFFALCVARAAFQLRSARTRAESLEAIGMAVPGLGGLFFACVVWSPSPATTIVLIVTGLATMAAGPALYERFVLGTRSRR